MYVGGVGRALSLAASASPHLFDAFGGPAMIASSQQSAPPHNPAGRLHASGEDSAERGHRASFTFPFSPYTRFTRNPADVVATLYARFRAGRAAGKPEDEAT